MPLVELPHNWEPRFYQRPILEAVDRGVRRIYQVWHRRAGKDITDLNIEAMQTQLRVGSYWHMLPEYGQARKAIWDGITKDGRRFIDAFPGALNLKATNSIVKSINKHEMKIEFKNGSIWQLVGADSIDSLVGSNPVGIVISEYALTNPKVLPFLEPILEENGGWLIINTTPRGKNHAHAKWEAAKKSPGWFTHMLTIRDTGVISEERIQQLRLEGTPEEIIQQEYYCSWNASILGAYYGEAMRRAEEDKRLTRVPYDPACEVQTWWDIGYSDYTSIWFVQVIGREIRLIDYHQENTKGPDHYVKVIKDKPYNYSSHNLPHDAGNAQFTLRGKSIKDQLEGMGLKGCVVHPRTPSLMADINTARSFISKCVFDEIKCADGISALNSYTKHYDEKLKTFVDRPLHNWASHGADAFRYLAVNYKEARPGVDYHALYGFNR